MKPWIEDRPEVRTMSKVEASWLAGVVDGEGSIGLYSYGREGRRVQVQMGNTHCGFVERFRAVIGCGSTVTRHEFHGTHKGRKPMFHCTVKGSARCYKVLKQIIPYLIIKREKAEAIVRELEEKPFGRWANATPEARARAADVGRSTWADADVRARRIAGMRRAAAK
jgi:hypothetical protein